MDRWEVVHFLVGICIKFSVKCKDYARYHLQASSQLDDNWTLMKTGLADTPTQESWLRGELSEGQRVGIDPYVISASEYLDLEKSLKTNGISLTPILGNLVDKIWSDRPKFPDNPIFPLGIEFTGVSFQEKLELIRDEMKKKRCELKVLTALDNIAWTLNLRGSDITYNPVFFSYLYFTEKDIYFFVDQSR